MDDDECTNVSGATTKRGASPPKKPTKRLKSLRFHTAPDFKNGAGNRPVRLQFATADDDVSQAGDRFMTFRTADGPETECNVSYSLRSSR
jgi:hypothetical protein